MFYLISVGLKPKDISYKALEVLKQINQVYIDNYTNVFSSGDLEELEKIINKKIKKLNRVELEQEQEFLKDNNALLVIGNATSATTHYSLIKDAENKNIKTEIISGISIFNYRGIAGLFEYKFGKTTSIVYPQKNYFPKSFFKTIKDNLTINGHTLCLLDIKIEENKLMSVTEAIELLKEIDTENILKDKWFIGLFGMGSDDEKIISFKLEEYKKINYNKYPQSLIVCAELNEFERECIYEFRIK